MGSPDALYRLFVCKSRKVILKARNIYKLSLCIKAKFSRVNFHKASDVCSIIPFPVVISVVCVIYYEVIRSVHESKEPVHLHVH
jgi:hypothetical protein